MSNVYEAIVKGNKLDWIGIPPKEIMENKKIKVKVILSEESENKTKRGLLMAEALKKIADRSMLKSIKNPTAWQREIRKDRTLKRKS
jgi:hypothetical protein